MTMIVLAVCLSLLIGVSLGLLGGGGSILTVPILIYALGVEEKSAIASSLLIVGVTSLVASVQHARAKNVVWRVAMIFAASAMVGAFLGGRVARFIPSPILLALFAVIMLGTALAMWRGRKPALDVRGAAGLAPKPLPIPLILVEGIVVGFVTGLVGAGGGFLVVPALALLGGLSMKQAVGSSLVVIGFKSFAGFAGYVTHAHVDWSMTLLVMAVAVIGSFGGAHLANKIPAETLRKGFAVLVLVMALLLMGKQAQAVLAKRAMASAPNPSLPHVTSTNPN